MVKRVNVPVEHRLPAPESCNCCNSSSVSLQNNSVLYGKSYGEWPLVYYCEDCGASVSCHKGTNIPMGYLADVETKKLRNQLHNAFDPLWKPNRFRYGSRIDMYKWLAKMLGINIVDCHISRFNTEQCKRAIKLCNGLDRFMKSHKKVTIYDYIPSE